MATPPRKRKVNPQSKVKPESFKDYKKKVEIDLLKEYEIPPYNQSKEYEEVNHPKHYNHLPNGIECIDVIEHFPANIANSMKYLWRGGHKPSSDVIKDLEKAIWYAQRQIALIKGNVPRIYKGE